MAGRWADGWSLSKPQLSALLAGSSTAEPGKDPADVELWAAWREIVEMYSRMRLTNAADKLPALSGVARIFSERSRSRYLAGLWEPDLAYQLAWRVYKYGVEKKKRPMPWRAPSWSWAAVDAPVTMIALEGPFLKRVAVRGCEAVASGVDPTGAVAGGALRVHGAVVEGTFAGEKDGEAFLEREGVTQKFFADVLVEGGLEIRERVWCLEMGFSDMTFIDYDTARDLTAMVLRRSRAVEGAFERVGFVSTPDRKVWKWFEEVEYMELNIV
ncbi:hypothetical protein AOQ84DRAFT_291962 [Glonium stellatum]|uniref:Uncharacterized protein n=1 Tax=Glonium stellatum TaxID=574774 RepID=A0A8E2F2G8_9PEZI|nr:hypothetical protein AOQ84DRAFT_291962 [Glonium stellatum]